MRARLIKLACLAACSLFSFSAFADHLSTNCYTATTAQSPVKQGAKEVVFVAIGFTGSIGNASFSNQTATIPISSGQDGDRLNEIAYVVTSGTLIICDLR